MFFLQTLQINQEVKSPVEPTISIHSSQWNKISPKVTKGEIQERLKEKWKFFFFLSFLSFPFFFFFSKDNALHDFQFIFIIIFFFFVSSSPFLVCLFVQTALARVRSEANRERVMRVHCSTSKSTRLRRSPSRWYWLSERGPHLSKKKVAG